MMAVPYESIYSNDERCYGTYSYLIIKIMYNAVVCHVSICGMWQVAAATAVAVLTATAQ